MKTSELQGAALDWAVAKADGLEFMVINGGVFIPDEDGVDEPYQYRPSTVWDDGGPIIDREGIALQMHFGDWIALPYDSAFSEEAYQQGPTPLIAAMRCYVASQLGDEVSIPEELI
jgi:hypothetical protein